MDKKRKGRIQDHLKRVSKEVKKLLKEIRTQPDEFGNVENRLYWALKGIDPETAICTKHNRKLHQNDHGEFICGDCADNIVDKAYIGINVYDENLWFDPDDEPVIKISGITYGK
jgi:hypothetical protein